VNSSSLASICKNKIDGVLRCNYSFDEKESKFAFLFAPTENDTIHNINIINLNDNNEILIKDLPKDAKQRTIINDFYWINSEKLLINLATVNAGLMENSSWIYRLEGGK